MFALRDALAIGSGGLVGFSLGLVGGGGSILATPLLLYVVGVGAPHVAIGTSALAVAVNAFANLIPHSRAGHVKWPCAAVFAGAGVLGALAGSSLGKAIDGQKLLFLFALLMFVVGAAMFRRRGGEGDAEVRIDRRIALRLVVVGFLTGALAGFFGIGGGFLVVPGLILGAGMPMIYAVGSSLFSVGAFGLTTAANYAWAGLIDWRIAALFIGGGVAGGWAGAWLAGRLGARKAMLNRLFAGLIFLVGGYTLLRSASALGLL